MVLLWWWCGQSKDVVRVIRGEKGKGDLWKHGFLFGVECRLLLEESIDSIRFDSG